MLNKKQIRSCFTARSNLLKRMVTMERRSGSLYPNSFTLPALAVFGIFFVLPTVAAFLLGFTDWNVDRIFQPKFNGIQNFVYLFQDGNFKLALKNTAIFAVYTTIFKVLFGLLLALAVNRPLITRNYLRTLFYMPSVLSMVVVGIMFSSIFNMDGMVNHILGFLGIKSLQLDWLGDRRTALFCTIVAEIWKWSGFGMAIFLAGLQNISNEYYEAANIDGASPFQQFRNITVPLLAPAFNITITISLIGGLKVFEQVFVLTGGGPGFASQVMSTYIFRAFSEGTYGRSTAMGLVLFVAVYVTSKIFNSILRRKEVDA